MICEERGKMFVRDITGAYNISALDDCLKVGLAAVVIRLSTPGIFEGRRLVIGISHGDGQ